MLALKLGNSLNSASTGQKIGGYSLDFDGVDSYIDLDSAVGVIEKTAGTFGVWAKLETTSATRTFMQARTDSNNYLTLFYHAGTNQLRFTYRAGGTTDSATYATTIENDNKWHHIACTWSTGEDEIKLYLDGEKVAELEGIGTWAGSISAFDIGQDTTGAKYYLGYLTEAALFNEVVSITSIVDNNQGPLNLTGMAGLVGYWKMDEGSGSKIGDSSGEGNQGTLTNTSNVSWITAYPSATDAG